MLETNVDDMNPEVYSYLVPLLFEKGALDVYLTNIVMKKNRPAIKINVLCEEANSKKFEDILFNETTTLGIRKTKIDRIKLQRNFIDINTKFGNVRLKVAYKDGKILKYSPEYEECKEIAKDLDLPIKDVYSEIMKETRETVNSFGD